MSKRKWNNAHQKMGPIKYGQGLLDLFEAMDLNIFRSRYEADRTKDLFLTTTHGVDEVMNARNIDALLFPFARIRVQAGHEEADPAAAVSMTST